MDSSRTDEAPSRLPRGLTVTGDLSSSQDLFIDGAFDGQITVPEQQVTISQTARVKAKIIARAVAIAGAVDGTVIASQRVTIAETAHVTGHLQTPSVSMKEGATFDGSVDPSRTEAAVHVARYRQKHPDAAEAD